MNLDSVRELKQTLAARVLPQIETTITTRSAFGRAAAEFSGIGITRIGRGYGSKVNVPIAPAPGVVLPNEIQGGPVRVEVVGAIRKRAA